MKKSIKMIAVVVFLAFINLTMAQSGALAAGNIDDFALTKEGGLKSWLYRMNSSERRILANILWKVEGKDDRLDPEKITPEAIQDKLMFVYGNALTCWFSKFREVPYAEIVVDVAENLGIETSGKALDRLEMEILTTHTRMIWDKMSPKERQEATRQIITSLQKDNLWYQFDEKTRHTIKTRGPVAAVMALMEVGGFQTYKILVPLVLKTVATIAGVLGITIAFGSYAMIATGTAKALSILLGPIGWGILIGSSLWGILNTNYEKLTAFVEAFALMRLAKKTDLHH
jgi:uncharacterized protein YaaW (UPF0174 family)